MLQAAMTILHHLVIVNVWLNAGIVASEPYTINDKQEGKGGIVALAPCYCPAEIYSSHAFTSSKNQ